MVHIKKIFRKKKKKDSWENNQGGNRNCTSTGKVSPSDYLELPKLPLWQSFLRLSLDV